MEAQAGLKVGSLKKTKQTQPASQLVSQPSNQLPSPPDTTQSASQPVTPPTSQPAIPPSKSQASLDHCLSSRTVKNLKKQDGWKCTSVPHTQSRWHLRNNIYPTPRFPLYGIYEHTSAPICLKPCSLGVKAVAILPDQPPEGRSHHAQLS